MIFINCKVEGANYTNEGLVIKFHNSVMCVLYTI